MKSRTLPVLGGIFLVFLIASYWNFLANMGTSFGRDWDETFNPASFFIRSAVWKFHELPLYNPWHCAGGDTIANPQMRTLSPLVLLDIFFPAQWANLLSLLIYGLMGAFGGFFCFRDLGFSKKTSVAATLLFLNGSWFALRYTEGHLVYGAGQLLPLFFYFGLNLADKKRLWGLAVAFSVVVLDGAIQMAIYSAIVVLIAATYRRPKGFPIKDASLLLLACVMVVGAKTIPVFMALARSPVKETTVMSPLLVLHAFFDPFQHFHHPAAEGYPFHFHEFGCYLGWTALILLIFGVALRAIGDKRTRLFIFAFVFFLWVGTGWGGIFNPWTIWQQIPLINNAHVQSRFFIVMYFFLVVLVAFALQAIRNERIWSAVVVLLLAETFFVRFYASRSISDGPQAAVGWSDFINSHTIRFTNLNGGSMRHYLLGNQNAILCGDKSYPKNDVVPSMAVQYRGQVFVDKGKGRADLMGAGPNEFTLRYQLAEPSEVVMNSLHFLGWQPNDPSISVLSDKPNEQIRLAMPAGEGVLTLRYHPKYFWWTLGLLVGGWILFGVLGRHHLKTLK